MTAAPRVLVLLKTEAAWSRGILSGFMAAAHERGWTLLYYNHPWELQLLSGALQPVAGIVATEFDAPALSEFGSAARVSVTVDRVAQHISSVCLDEAAIGEMAYQHLQAAGIRNVATFRYDESGFAIAREAAFVEAASAGGARVAPGWGVTNPQGQVDRSEDPAAMVAWLRALPKPCGIFTCTDGWARAVSRYTLLAGLRIPEDIALIGADNDVLECELMSPPLSTVAIPWREVGKSVATLLQRALSGKPGVAERVMVAPLTVIARRSTQVLAVDDTLVASAVEWIHANAAKRMTVPTVARAVGSGRHRLERAFRRGLGRTVQAEIRRARVEAAKKLLEASRASLTEVAKATGFKTASLLTAAFQRELGVTPGSYRRRVQHELTSADTD